MRYQTDRPAPPGSYWVALHLDQMDAAAFRTIDHWFRTKEGFTVDMAEWQEPEQGYVVATPETMIFEAEDYEACGDTLRIHHLRSLMDGVAFKPYEGQAVGLGGWWDSDNECYELAVVVIFERMDQALKYGARNGERYMWDVSNQQEIPIQQGVDNED